MIVDNFNLFKKIINPYNDDEFYFIQILIRGKDGHTEQGVNGSNKNRLIKFYTIKSAEHLAKLKMKLKLFVMLLMVGLIYILLNVVLMLLVKNVCE